ncbi:DUF6984 family protein [Luteibacter sp. NPDC031894]|uniref:DUF6984 family protein n=1 Tax=Luteibacter sp. NPDC031894 TaxID=3390572 RepID=UPI003CFE84CA
MSSHFREAGAMRHLRTRERSLLKHLMQKGGIGSADEQWLDAVVVADLDDGGMGSFRILEPSSRGYDRVLSEVEFNDVDGTKVLASLYVDADAAPCEVDVWKVDFSPLRTLPMFDDRESS